MTYQITYFSPNGHAEKLAALLRELLPPDTRVEALGKQTQAGADVQLVGFDLKMVDLHTLPLNIVTYLKGLDGKTVFLFATVPFRTDDVLSRQVHKNVTAALPAQCDYRGLHLCPAQSPDMLVEGFRNVVQRNPSNIRAKHWLERCEQAQGHPNEADSQALCRFARHVLKLDT